MDDLCSVPGCMKQRYARELCKMHHGRMLRGDRSVQEVIERAKQGHRIYRFNFKGTDLEGWMVSENDDGSITVETYADGFRVIVEAQPYHFERMA